MIEEIVYTIDSEKSEEFRKKLDQTAATAERWDAIKKESQILDRNRLFSLVRSEDV